MTAERFARLCDRVRRFGYADGMNDGWHIYIERHGANYYLLRDVRGNLMAAAREPEEFAGLFGASEQFSAAGREEL